MGCKHYCLLTLLFLFSFQLFAQDILLLKTDGKVVIGDTSQISTPENYQLYVQNGILTERVKVALKESADWSDDSFERTPTLEAVQQSIKNNSHLINIPSAEEVSTKGYELHILLDRLNLVLAQGRLSDQTEQYIIDTLKEFENESE